MRSPRGSAENDVMKSVATNFFLPLCLLTALFVALDAYVVHRSERGDLTQILHKQTELALAFDLAIRSYTAEEIRPLMVERIAPDEFYPEAMSTSYVARSIFEKVREKFPDYIIKFSSSNPRNPINQAGPSERKMIDYFSAHPDVDTWSGEIELDGRDYIAQFSARRMKESCLRCHGEPEDAPAALVQRYGDTAGFHLPVGEVVALDTVAIPVAVTAQALRQDAIQHLGVMAVEVLALLALAAWVFRSTVLKRLRAMQRRFEQIVAQPVSTSLREVEEGRNDEIGVLARSFNKLTGRLRAAHESLEKRVAERTTELEAANVRLRDAVQRREQSETAALSMMEDADNARADAVLAEQALATQASQQAAVADLGQKALTITDPLTLFREATELIAATLDVEYCKILELRPGGDALRLVAGVGWNDGLVGRVNVPSDRGSQSGFTLLASEPVVVEDLRTEERFHGPQLLFDHGIVSGMTAVIRGPSSPWGVLGVHTTQQRIFTRDDVSFLESVTTSLADAIARHAVEAQLETQSHRLQEQKKDLLTANLALKEARDAAEAANRSKSEFLANMSHEIRTPMTAILGFADMLLERGDPTQAPVERLDAAQTIRKNGEYLLGIINDILDLSKIEAGKLTVERIDCSLTQVVSDVISLIRVRAEGKGLPVTVDYHGPIPLTIQTDPTRLRQILINVLANAVKFTEAGEVRLSIRAVRDPRAPVIQFDVKDTGVGMNQEQVTQLFRPFTQADASTTRSFGGTGLGLTISKRLARMLGGDVTVIETQRGTGTRFRMTIATGPLNNANWIDRPDQAREPDATATSAAHPDARAPSAQTSLADCRVLVVEDGLDNQRLILHFLKTVGADVTLAENGKLAVETAIAANENDTPFEIILMDMQMPIMGGYEATQLLREIGHVGPIIALTAHAMDGDREKCLQAGCDDYLVKPIDRKKLIATVAAYTHHSCAAADAH